jgi:hypothetical protein
MPQNSPDLAVVEYRALRATIRERGTARLVTAPAIFVVWAALAIAVQTWSTMGLWMLGPLVVLAAGFEGIFALHVGVERIGRYLQVFYEDTAGAPPWWEHAAMEFGQTGSSAGPSIDPLFSWLFGLAALLNLSGAALLSIDERPSLFGISPAFLLCGLFHAAFAVRLWRARRFAGTQRQADLRRFQELRGRML